jgi:hypothetical protein
MERDDEEAAAEVGQMQAEGRAEIENDLALFASKKTVRGLQKTGRRIL